MKKRSLLKTMLLLCALIVGYGSAWGQDTWEKTDPADLQTGDIIVLVDLASSKAMANNNGNSAPAAVAVTVANDKITSIDNEDHQWTTIQWTVTVSGEGQNRTYQLQTGTSYLYVTKSNNGVRVGSGGRNTFTIKTGGNNGGYYLYNQVTGDNADERYVGCYDNQDWRCYNSINANIKGNNNAFFKKVAGSTPTCATPTFDPAGGTYTSDQTVSISTTTEGATIRYTTNGSEPTASSTAYSMPIYASNGLTIKAIAVKDGYNNSEVATATYTILEHAGTETDPYSVADARAAIDANSGVSEVYATGIVSEIVTEYSSEYKNITFNISADGLTTSAQLQAFRCKKGDGDGDPDVQDIKVGDEVVVKGNLTKHNSTYEFAANNVLISLKHPTTPLITVDPISLTGFTYGVGSGPSAAQTFSVEGSNLTANISLSLGESDYEMSLSEGSGYTNSLTISQTAGTVAATTVYVRLKAGLAVNASYEGTVTLTSTGATNKAVSLAGSVTQPNFTWDLSTNSYSAASADQVTWTGTYATMNNQKGSSSNAANNYLGGDANKRTSSRFYSNQILTIAPTSGYTITSIEFTATTENYATILKNSTWANATAAASGTTVTVSPANGALPISATIGNTCGFTAVKVYYGVVTSVPLTPAKTYTTLTSSHNLDFTSVSSVLEAYIVKDDDTSDGYVTLTQVNKVPAGTGLVLKATNPGSAVSVPVFDGTGAADVTGNKMAGSATETTAIAANAGYILSDGVFQPAKKGTLAAGKAYLNIAVSAGAPQLALSFDGEGTTGIGATLNDSVNDNVIYDLSGRRVAKPTKGIYIVNGKKYVVK